MRILAGKPEPLFEHTIAAKNHKKSTKKHEKSSIPPHIKEIWAVIYQNFTIRHRNLKQGPLKLCYKQLNDFIEGLL